jgi:hypothetical protein
MCRYDSRIGIVSGKEARHIWRVSLLGTQTPHLYKTSLTFDTEVLGFLRVLNRVSSNSNISGDFPVRC